jgi:hypothetical protein
MMRTPQSARGLLPALFFAASAVACSGGSTPESPVDADVFDAQSDGNDAGNDVEPNDHSNEIDADTADTGAADVDAAELDSESENDDGRDGDPDQPAETVELVMRAPAGAVRVGDEFLVGCRAELSSGEPVAGVPTLVSSTTPSVVERNDDSAFTAIAPGSARFVCVDNRGILPDPAELLLDVAPGLPARLETVVDVTDVVAGSPVAVSCLGFDRFDNELGEVPAGVVVRTTDDGDVAFVEPAGAPPVILTRAEEHSFQCTMPGVFSSSIALVSVSPGPTTGLRIEPDSVEVIAGEHAAFTCEGRDLFDNPTGPVPEATLAAFAPEEVRRDPVVDGMRVQFFRTTTGPYTVRCVLDELVAIDESLATVLPARPVRVDGYLLANGTYVEIVDPFARPGSFVFPYIWVQDAYGNRIVVGVDNPGFVATIEPSIESTAFGWVLNEPGDYVVRVAWSDQSEGAVLPFEETIAIDGGGPRLDCITPANAEFTELVPGTTTQVQIQAIDTRDVAAVAINGVEGTSVGADIWEVPYVVEAGTNLLDVTAVDEIGQDSAVVCAFVAGYGYQPVDTPLASTIRLALSDNALDDQVRTDGINSLADLLMAQLEGELLRGQLEAQLLATSPIWEGTVDAGFFVLTGAVHYLGGFAVLGPNDVSLTAVEPGLELTIAIREVGFDLRIDTDIFGSGEGRVTMPLIPLAATVAVGMVDGALSTTVETFVPVVLAPLRGEFEDAVIDALFDVAEPTLRAELEAQINTSLGGAFESLLGGDTLGIGALNLSSTIEVPAFGGSESFAVAFDAPLSAAYPFGGHLFFELDTLFAAEAEAVLTLPGIPSISPGDEVIEPEGVAIFVSLDVLNQALVTLWQQGYFNVEVYDFGALLEFGDIDASITFRVEPQLPPLFSERGGRVVLSLGAVSTDVLDIAYGEGVIDARMGAEVSAVPTVDADGKLAFTDVRVDRGLASLQPASYTRSDYDRVVDGVLGATLLEFAESIFAAALPALPALVIRGTEATAEAGLGPDDVLTVGDYSARTVGRWIVLDGSLVVE